VTRYKTANPVSLTTGASAAPQQLLLSLQHNKPYNNKNNNRTAWHTPTDKSCCKHDAAQHRALAAASTCQETNSNKYTTNAAAHTRLGSATDYTAARLSTISHSSRSMAQTATLPHAVLLRQRQQQQQHRHSTYDKSVTQQVRE
jgi:hypothetical protein